MDGSYITGAWIQIVTQDPKGLVRVKDPFHIDADPDPGAAIFTILFALIRRIHLIGRRKIKKLMCLNLQIWFFGKFVFIWIRIFLHSWILNTSSPLSF